jgi:hypothetical protein
MSSEASAGRGTAAAGSADDDEDAAKAGFRRRRAGLAAAYALPFAVAPFLDVDATSASFRGVSGPPCLCAVATGLPCPGCGLTRGFAAAMQGDFALATAAHPAALVVVALAACGAALHAHAAWRGEVGPLAARALGVGRAIFIVSLVWTAFARFVA